MESSKTKKARVLQQLKQDLPPNWGARYSKKYKDRVFYFNTVTGKSSWNHPLEKSVAMPVPPTSGKKEKKLNALHSKSIGHRKKQLPGQIPNKTAVLHGNVDLPNPETNSHTKGKSKTALLKKTKEKSIKNLAKRKALAATKADGDSRDLAKKQTVQRPSSDTEKRAALHQPIAAKWRTGALLASRNIATVGAKIKFALPKKSLRLKKLELKSKSLKKFGPDTRSESPTSSIKGDDLRVANNVAHSSDNINVAHTTDEPHGTKAPHNVHLQRTVTSTSEAVAEQCMVDTSKTDVEMQDLSGTSEPSSVKPSSAAMIFVVVDTNIFLMDLPDVSTIINWYPLPEGHFRRVVVVVPWIVLQELDGLKSNKNVMVRARKAVTFLNRHFSEKKPGLRGQTIMEAATFFEGLSPQVNDDRILQCCLFFNQLPGHHKTILLSRDTNLRNKALINHIRTFASAESLIKAVKVMCKEPSSNSEDWNDISSSSFTPEQSQNLETDSSDAAKASETARNEVDFVHLQDVLTTALSTILVTEMKEAYGDDLWKEIVFIQPPWSLIDVLKCIKKHWIAVFSMIGVDRIGSHLVNELTDITKRCRHSKALPSPGKTTYKQSRQTEDEWLSAALQLLKLLTRSRKYATEVSQSLEVLQKAKIKSVASGGSSVEQSVSGVAQSSSTNKNVGIIDNATAAGDMTSDEIEFDFVDDDIDNVDQSELTFWQVLNQVWGSVLKHCAAIFQSLSFVSSPSLNQLSTDLQQELVKASEECEIPSPAMSAHALPLLTQLVKSLIISLERILFHGSTAGALPLPADCLDLLQTVWTSSQAFTLQCNMERLRPNIVRRCVQKDEGRSNLTVGCNKLQQIYLVLEECSSNCALT